MIEQTKKSIEALPCPFCGKSPRVLFNHDTQFWWLLCNGCKLRHDFACHTREEAIENWNLRDTRLEAEVKAVREENARLRAVLGQVKEMSFTDWAQMPRRKIIDKMCSIAGLALADARNAAPSTESGTVELEAEI